MNAEMEIKLQAYLDGELSGRDAGKVAAWLEQDAAAQALCAELRNTKAMLQGNELELKLPESREFYWNKIERAISAQAVEAAAEDHSWAGFVRAWRRVLAPLAGVALVIALGLSLYRGGIGSSDMPLAEVENLSEDMGSFSFRSQSENTFVVWLYENGRASTPSMEEDEFIIQ